MNKRIVIIVMLLAAVAARAFDFSATTPTGQTVYYSIIGATDVKVVNPDWDNRMPPSGFLALPATVNNGGVTYQVKAIDAQAFMSCDMITGVSVPEGVTSIGRMAFAFCSALDSIVLPTTLESIGSMAFTGTAYYSDNSNINDQGLMIIDHYIIAARPNISTTVSVPTGILGLGNMAFYNCQQMPKVIIPTSVRFIGENTFSSCTGLDTVWMRSAQPPTLESNSFMDVTGFTVAVPCQAEATYRGAENWSALDIVPKCKPYITLPGREDTSWVGIENVEERTFTAVAVEGGLQVVLPDGYGCSIYDGMGRIVATLRNSGFVPLKNKGLYLVGSTQFGKTIKLIFSN